MTTKDTGGSAFPATNYIIPADLEARHVSALGRTQGMTLRDYFAAKAMQGMGLKWDAAYSPADRSRDQPEADARSVATAAYRYADAMLAARVLSNISAPHENPEGGK